MHTFLFNSVILSSTCFELLSIHHQEVSTSNLTVFYHAEVIIKLYELSRYKILNLYNVTKTINVLDIL